MRQDIMRGVPRDINAMRDYIHKMFELRTHVRGISNNSATNALTINLAMTSHNVGAPDVYLPIKRGKGSDAAAILTRILSAFTLGFSASDSDVLALFDLIDHQAG